uniref:Uncharacterized protein n=2 Tax=Sus scrofa TaxID=9823 RepID=A0A8D1QDN5_PIG
MRRHQPNKVTQDKKGKDVLCAQGKRCYTGSRVAMVGRLGRFSGKRLKLQRRLECADPNCRSKRMLAIRRCTPFELGGDTKRKGQAIQFCASYFYYEDNTILRLFPFGFSCFFGREINYYQ